MANTFTQVTDYFGFGNANLIPEFSDSGDTHYYQTAFNGQSETPASQTGAVWRNPTVRYRVVGNTTLDITLGSAYAGIALTSVTQTGYMITSVEVDTSIGVPPVITVKGVANEGCIHIAGGYSARATPAIKTYRIQIPLLFRHRPQNLLNCLSLSGRGELQSLSLEASADPVVLVENGAPCASDICHGRIQVQAKVASYNDEPAPTAGSGFTMLNDPVYGAGRYYKSYNLRVIKELI